MTSTRARCHRVRNATAHSDKEKAAPTFKRGFGFHPLCAFIDHGPGGTGEPAAMTLRAGNAGANTAIDHKKVLAQALEQLPWRPGCRVGRKVLVRTDAGGGTHEFVAYCHQRRVQYSVGFGLSETIVTAMDRNLPKTAWTPAYDSDCEVRGGAWVAEITGLIDVSTWPPGMRVIVRKERPHPGVQLRFTDLDGLRLTAFATNTTKGQRRPGPARSVVSGPSRAPGPATTPHGPILLSPYYRGIPVSRMLEVAAEHQLEGVIGKRVDAPHRSGRSRAWRKLPSKPSRSTW